jgi:hypothetical protein
MTEFREEDGEFVNVFCIDGVVVKTDRAKAESRLPYDIMTVVDQPVMKMSLEAQGKDVQFLTPMTADMLIADLGGEVLENINKDTVNMVADLFGEEPVFGDDEDGILK